MLIESQFKHKTYITMPYLTAQDLWYRSTEIFKPTSKQTVYTCHIFYCQSQHLQKDNKIYLNFKM